MNTDNVEKNVDIRHIICSSRDEQERYQELGLPGAGVGGLLMFRIRSHSALSTVWMQQTDLCPLAAWEVRAEGAGALAWCHCLVQHIRHLDLSCSEISFRNLGLMF